MDADDYWNEDKLQKQIDLFLYADDKLGFVYGKSEVVYHGDGNKPFFWSEHEKLYEGDIFYKLVKSNFIVFSSLVVSKKKFFECGGFPHEFVNSTDYYILVRMAKNYNCKFLDEICCYYRVHNNNLSKRQKAISVLEAIKVCKEFLPDQLVEKGMRNHYADLALIYIKEYKFSCFFKLLFEKKMFANFFTNARKKNLSESYKLIAYWTLFLVPFLATLVPLRASKELRTIAFTFFFLLASILIGLRYQIGGDWSGYMVMLEAAKRTEFLSIFSFSDPAYYLLNWISIKMGLGIFGVNLIGGLFLSIVYWFFVKNSHYHG